MDWAKVKEVLTEIYNYFKAVFSYFYPESEELFDKVEENA